MPKNSTPGSRPSQEPAFLFPLRLHASGQYYKAIRGRFFYFGKDATAALAEWLRVKDYLLAGKAPPDPLGRHGPTLGKLCNLFLHAKQARLETGELSAYTYADWRKTCDRLTQFFGVARPVESIGPADFLAYRAELAEHHKSLQTLGYQITRARSVFAYAYRNDLIEKPVKFGDQFRAPSKRSVRRQKIHADQTIGKRLFTADQIRQLLEAADAPLAAMIHLAINCAFGNADCGTLPLSAIDVIGGSIAFPRPKTAAPRPYLPLWPESLDALAEALRARPKPAPSADHLFFVTDAGRAYHSDTGHRAAISQNFIQLAKSVGVYRPRLTFYAIRHTFETIAGDAKDQVAVDAIMGHVDGSMAGEYREGIDPARIDAVVNHVRSWLFSG